MGKELDNNKKETPEDKEDITNPDLQDFLAEKETAVLLKKDKEEMAELSWEKQQEQKKIKEIDAQMAAVQRSTRTLIPQFIRLHNFCRLKWQWYYKWHTNPYSSLVHCIALVLYIIGLAVLFISMLFWGPTHKAHAASCVAQATGNWNAGATWSGCGANGPVAGDTATINAAYTVTLTANAAATTLTVSNGTLDIATYNLAISGTSTVSGGAVTIGASASTGWTTSVMSITSGSVTCTGISLINVSSTFSNAATFTAGSSVLTFTGSGSTITPGSSTYYGVTFASTGGQTKNHRQFNYDNNEWPTDFN